MEARWNHRCIGADERRWRVRVDRRAQSRRIEDRACRERDDLIDGVDARIRSGSRLDPHATAEVRKRALQRRLYGLHPRLALISAELRAIVSKPQGVAVLLHDVIT